MERSDDRVGSVAGLAAISGAGQRGQAGGQPGSGYRQACCARQRLVAPVEEREFGMGTAERRFAGRHHGHPSRMLVMDEAERTRMLATIRDFLHRQPRPRPASSPCRW